MDYYSDLEVAIERGAAIRRERMRLAAAAKALGHAEPSAFTWVDGLVVRLSAGSRRRHERRQAGPVEPAPSGRFATHL